MSNILEQYGIKEVADVTFYKIGDSGANKGMPTYPVLYLDTLKVSTIEQTAEEVTANGGKGNPALVSWDYGKEITVTLEDALFSAKSMAIMFGDGNYATAPTELKKTIKWTVNGSAPEMPKTYKGGKGKTYTIPSEYTIYDASGSTISSAAASTKLGETFYVTFNVPVETDKSGMIEISGDTFPGTYYVTGDTYARSSVTGDDEYFQFIIPKAKVQSGNTITLEAEGDPSVFNMDLRVLRPDDGVMMRLIKYDITPDAGAEG